MKIGIGYDIHRLVEDRPLVLGGEEIPYIKGLFGHSDGDVLAHAVIDAILGAASLQDIGEMFPDYEPDYKDISSLKLLSKVADLLNEKSFKIQNIDSVVICEDPMLAPFKSKMKKNIAEALRIKIDQINIKAKTNEKIGPLGANEAIAAYAVVLLQ